MRHYRRMTFPLPQPTLHAERYLLRPYEPDDTDMLMQAAQDDYIPLFTSLPAGAGSGAAVAYRERQLERTPAGVGYSFALARSDTGRAVGQVGVWLHDFEKYRRVTVGYFVVASERRRGAATAGLSRATQWAFEQLPIVRSQLFVEPWNTASCRTAERAGYAREGLLRSWQEVGGEWRDMYSYARVR
jgi:RimJ/RimL family protein N-acetyltransferase